MADLIVNLSATTPLKVTQWVDFSLPITLRNPPTGVGQAGTPIDVTGFRAIGWVFKGFTATERVPLTFVMDPHPLTGQMSAHLPAVITGTIPYGLYLYEVKVIDSTDQVIQILKGALEVEAGTPNAIQ